MLPSPDQNLKLGRSVGIFFFFFFFLRTVRELSFPIFFLKFLNGENSGGMQSKRIYKSCTCLFKPLNTNFSKFFAQIWHLKKKKKKKNRPCFFAFYGRSGEGNITFFFFGLRQKSWLFWHWYTQFTSFTRVLSVIMWLARNKCRSVVLAGSRSSVFTSSVDNTVCKDVLLICWLFPLVVEPKWWL